MDSVYTYETQGAYLYEIALGFSLLYIYTSKIGINVTVYLHKTQQVYQRWTTTHTPFGFALWYTYSLFIV